MRLTDTDRDKLLLSYAAELAWRRARRGVRLNHPEAVAVISSFVLEGARDGAGLVLRRRRVPWKCSIRSAGCHVPNGS